MNQPAPAVAPGVVTSDGVTMRFRAPDPALSELVIDYAFYDSGPAGCVPRRNDYLPGPANISMTFAAGPVNARVRNHQYSWRNDAAVFGPTSFGIAAESRGGLLIGLGLTPLGWARLFGKNAFAAANRVGPLEAQWGRDRARAFYDAVARVAWDEDMATHVLDTHLVAALRPDHRDLDLVRALSDLLQDPAISDCAEVAARMDLPESQLRRIARHYFGFTPKLLIRRTRFIRTMAALTAGTPADDAFSPYYDQSHLIRDAHLFLGKTARQFGAAITPMMAGMIAGRAAAFGTPMQGLIAPGRDNVKQAPEFATPDA